MSAEWSDAAGRSESECDDEATGTIDRRRRVDGDRGWAWSEGGRGPDGDVHGDGDRDEHDGGGGELRGGHHDASTAASGEDYTALPSQAELTIGAGVASGTIQIVTNTDTVLEPDETLVLKLTAASTAGEVSVSDDDGDRRRSRITGAVKVSVEDAQAIEGESVQFEVELSGAVSSEVEGVVCDLGRHGSGPRR